MKAFEHTVTSETGIHARPAGLLVQLARPFSSEIFLECRGKVGDAKRLINVMWLGVKQGDVLRVECSGEDENDASSALEVFFRENL